MEDFKLQILLLIDTLQKKKVFLAQILNITENQEQLLKSKEINKDIDLMFDAMNEEKQKLIDEVLNADSFFQRVFSDIGKEFEEKSIHFRDMIKELQNLVREVMDLDVKIRVQEQNNRAYAIRSPGSKKINTLKASKEHVLNQYKKSNLKELD